MKIQKHLTLLFLITYFGLSGFAQDLGENQSVAYSDLIGRYTALSESYSTCDLISFGETDSGEPLHLFLLNSSGEFYPEALEKKAIVLIQNGIHAGEPCGIDASIEFAEEMLTNNTLPENAIIAIIPIYNIGGMKNRGCCSRANQNGPEEHGFRGNARNLDLNRDYIKADSKNAFAFYRIFHWLKPQIFVDTHTSNGADYQYTMTLLTTRKERLDPHLSQFLAHDLEPYIYANFDSLTPYVNVFGASPDSGIKAFNDMTRFSTGYASLFNCIGFTTEAHMWKPFEQRKEATHRFLKLITHFSDSNYVTLIENKRISDSEYPMSFEALNLALDPSKSDVLNFLSYQPEYRYSEILGREQLYYNREKPAQIQIPYFNYYNKVDEIQVPKYYYISSAWKEVIQRLQANEIEMTKLEEDTVLTGLGTYIESFSNGKNPYEGHYLHKEVQTKDSTISMQFYSGDYQVSTAQKGWRYVLNVLEPKSKDSFFAWNFYDEITQQKEWYSAYVFEPYAREMLDNDPFLRMEYERNLETNPQFEKGDYRLYWLYTKSSFYEPVHNRMPLIRMYE